MNLEEIKTLEKQYVMQTYARNDLFLVKGQGCLLYDDQGSSYIDMTSGIGRSITRSKSKAYAHFQSVLH